MAVYTDIKSKNICILRVIRFFLPTSENIGLHRYPSLKLNHKPVTAKHQQNHLTRSQRS